ncbi:MAG: cob(I)yrinic acid a,c-diamide adenosyltransferase [Promethearchaeota archaeon]
MSRKIFTSKGDRGKTTLLSGERVDKTDPRIDSCGAIDELNACLGIVKSFASEDLNHYILEIQKKLFKLSTELATSDPRQVSRKVSEDDTAWLEKVIDDLSTKLPRIKNFIIPGGTHAAVFLHLSRTTCRRAERIVVGLAKQEAINPEILKFLNRLSDCLFTLARHANIIGGKEDQLISGNRIFTQKAE